MKLKADSRQVELTVSDNGHGEKPDEKGDRCGLGLAGMQMRARGCGGNLMVKSDVGKGFTIAVTCPIGVAAN